jgi:hypothetical protein
VLYLGISIEGCLAIAAFTVMAGGQVWLDGSINLFAESPFLCPGAIKFGICIISRAQFPYMFFAFDNEIRRGLTLANQDHGTKLFA